MSNSNRLESLDSLRGIAAMGVVIYHYTSLFGYSQGFTQLIDFFPSPYDNPGRYGVELFFIISGFVITMSLENSKSVYHFFVARFSRLYPTFWFCLTFTFILKSLYYGDFKLIDYFFNLTMAPSFFGYDEIDGAYWTLTYELFFYLAIGFFYYISKEITPSVIFLTTVILTTLLFSLDYNGFKLPYKLQLIFLLPYLHLFASGIMFYRLWVSNHRGCKESSSNLTLLLYISILCLIPWQLASMELPRYNSLSATLITFFHVLMFGVVFGGLGVISNRVLVYLGRISFSLYLIHQEVGYIMIQTLFERTSSMFISILTTLVLIIGLAHYINKYVENPSYSAFKKILLKRAK